MSISHEEAAYDEYLTRLYNEYGPEWAAEHKAELRREYYNEVVSEFTTERLKSYYVAHPDLAGPAHASLLYAQSLLPTHPMAALVFAATATELAVKTVLLRPIIFGLVHTEGFAFFITELTTQITCVDKFHSLLTEILAQFGGVDLETLKRPEATKTLWQEIAEVQKARNAVLHRGEIVDESKAHLAIAVAGSLLNDTFPQVLGRLGLHSHGPTLVCGKKHGTTVSVCFVLAGGASPVFGSVELEPDDLALDAMPDTITGKLRQ